MQRDNLEVVFAKTKTKFKKSKFSKAQFMGNIIGIENRYRSYSSLAIFSLIRLTRNNFDEDVANTVLNEFMSKGVIESVKSKDLDDWYKVA